MQIQNLFNQKLDKFFEVKKVSKYNDGYIFYVKGFIDIFLGCKYPAERRVDAKKLTFC